MALSYEEDMKRRERDAQLQKQNQQVSGAEATRIIGGTAAAGLYPSINMLAQGTGRLAGAANTAARGLRGLGRLGVASSGFNGALDGFNTSTEQYRDRFGMQTDNPTFAGDLVARTAGVLSDVGDNLLLGAPSKIGAGLNLAYLDKNMSKWNQPAADNAPPQAGAPNRQGVSTVDNPFYAAQAQANMQNANGALSTFSGAGNYDTATSPMSRQTQANPAVGKQVLSQAQVDELAPRASGSINSKPIDNKDAIQPKPMYDTAQERALQQTYSEVNAPNTRMPVRQARDFAADLERKNLIDAIKRPAGGASIMDGLTANQQKMLAEIAMQGDNLDMEAYKQQMAYGQANMAQQNQNARTNLEQQNTMTKSLLDEAGQNSRSQAQLGLDVSKLNQLSEQEQAKLGLESEKLAMEKQKNNAQNYAQNMLIALQDQYNKATTDEERQAIKQKSQQYTALMSKGTDGKDRYVTVKAGDSVDAQGNVLAQPERVLDTQTGMFIDSGQAGQAAQPAVQVGAVMDGYRFKGGDPADANNWEKL